jgi:hypothetical protein
LGVSAIKNIIREVTLKDERPAPVRLTKKSLFIIDKVKIVNDNKINKSKTIEDALVEKYPLFNEMYKNNRVGK